MASKGQDKNLEEQLIGNLPEKELSNESKHDVRFGKRMEAQTKKIQDRFNEELEDLEMNNNWNEKLRGTQ